LHFHESGHRAHDGAVKPVLANTFVEELYWNSGQLYYANDIFIIHLYRSLVYRERILLRLF